MQGPEIEIPARPIMYPSLMNEGVIFARGEYRVGIFAGERERERKGRSEQVFTFYSWRQIASVIRLPLFPGGAELGFVPGFIQALCALFVHALFIIRRHYDDSVANIYPFS